MCTSCYLLKVVQVRYDVPVLSKASQPEEVCVGGGGGGG